MFDNLDNLQKEYDQLQKDLINPKIVSNPEKLREISKRRAKIEPVIEKYNELKSVEKEISQNQGLIESENDSELISIAVEDNRFLEVQKEKLSKELKLLLSPEANSSNEIILEIRAGTGGGEAALFASDLFRMYNKYSENNGWKVKILSSSTTELGGVKEIVSEIKGDKVFDKLKFESGVHRVQRIPKTEKSGRIHTSTATVAVLESGDEVNDVAIEPKDIRIDIFRSSGPGGQSVNTTDSAVRIIHTSTGIVVSCQDERSQLKNKEKAMKILKTRLLARIKEEREEKESAARKTQIKTAKRSEKIRTYNFPQDRITDHRLKKNWGNLSEILEGNLGKIVDG